MISVSFAQHTEQPQKELDSDRREVSHLFEIYSTKTKKSYSLERTANYEYFLRLKMNNIEKVIKVLNQEAKKIDNDFSARFLRCLYELKTKGGPCEVVYKLTLRGEAQEICKKDDEKSREFSSVLKFLDKRF